MKQLKHETASFKGVWKTKGDLLTFQIVVSRYASSTAPICGILI